MRRSGLLEDLPSGWRVIPFGQVVLDSAFGPRFSGEAYAGDGNVATLRTTDMDDDGLICYETMPLATLELAKFQSHILRKDDLVITRSGTCGIAGIFRGFEMPVLPGAFLVRLRVNQDADVRFFRYFFNSKPGRAHLLSIAAGAVQQNINLTNLLKLPVPVPPLPRQRRIADMLAAYDDLIENSQRRIRILETMARALYREWFVHFRFPGHEDVPRVASSLGKTPKDWEVKQLGDIAEDMRRNVPKGELAEPRPYVGLEHIPRRSLALDAWDTVTELGSNKLEFKKGEVLFGKIRPYFHKVSVAPFDGLCSADTIVVRARRPEHWALVAACVSSDAFVAEASATANGAKMPRANWDVLERFRVPIPSGAIVERFSALFSGLVEQEQALIFQIQNLRRTRDLLLPRLLSRAS